MKPMIAEMHETQELLHITLFVSFCIVFTVLVTVFTTNFQYLVFNINVKKAKQSKHN